MSEYVHQIAFQCIGAMGADKPRRHRLRYCLSHLHRLTPLAASQLGIDEVRALRQRICHTLDQRRVVDVITRNREEQDLATDILYWCGRARPLGIDEKTA